MREEDAPQFLPFSRGWGFYLDDVLLSLITVLPDLLQPTGAVQGPPL
ncbi:MAG: hypothetical protein OEV70_12065 [Nitrospirota bacterium]|nr:hypothetical protein [Nitrospirota bacterium]